MTQTLRHISLLCLMWCCCSVSLEAMGQERVRLVEGEIHSFSVEEVMGRKYNWILYSGFSMMTHASSDLEAGFLGSPKLSVVSCVFKKPGDYVLRSNTEQAGCLNSRVLILNILPNHMTLGFINTDQEACATSIGDLLPLDLTIEKDLETRSTTYEKYFPLRVSIRVYEDSKDKGTQDIIIDREDDAMALNLKIDDLDEDHRYSIRLLKAQTNNGLPIGIVDTKRKVEFLLKKRPRAGKILIVE
ncbi:hypothetical protein K5X82_13250 [Halosquirtibacter xylanolyticus]|uniref:hypothetical protein n=1 Tax=Halosquirtibacter xylanolyticus TaxID=3374599 RepID=UPI0037494D84|nr:hypothetical protein K5X82_13250 [Prolixibacteraceae bacterium]